MGRYDKKKRKTPVFGALEADKENLHADNKSDKTTKPNEVFTGAVVLDNLNTIPLNRIDERVVNNFDSISIETLKYSIRRIGLLSPISIRIKGNRYTVIAGHRRLAAYKEILEDIDSEIESEKNVDKLELLKEERKKFERIPANVYEVVVNDSELLGTSPSYITQTQEEEMYEASNLENRQISENQLLDHMDYFYKLITTNEEYRMKMLDKRNENAKRNATKLDIPSTISNILTKELNFKISAETVRRYVKIIEYKKKYEEYGKIVDKRLKNHEKIKPVYNDFKMYAEIMENNKRDMPVEEAKTRILKGKQSVKEVYDECFNIKPEIPKKVLSKKEIIELLYEVKKGKITIDELIKQIETNS